MPYIEDIDKEMLDNGTKHPIGAGELNYKITRLLQEYLKWNKVSYQSFNDIMGALEGAKLEIYRRKIAPYEDEKIKKNGDVY